MHRNWDSCANIRKAQIESGTDLTFSEVFVPLYTEAISAIRPKNILEVGAGTGHLSRALSAQNYEMTVIEPSLGMYTVAKDVLSHSQVKLLNCTINDLPVSEEFDLVFSHMVAQVVENLGDFLFSTAAHVRRKGFLLLSIPHPCFYNSYKKFFGPEYQYMVPMYKNVSFHISLDRHNEISNVPYYHRPLSYYINALVSAGFVLYGFQEVFPKNEVQTRYGALWESSRYCLFKCKRL